MDNTTKQKIELQEAKDRFVASECLKFLFRNQKNLIINPTDITDWVDLNCIVDTNNKGEVPFNVEIKERFKSPEQLAKYPNAELKVDKYERMKAVTPKGTVLFYMVLLNNEKCLIFNMDKINWDNVVKKNWWIKRTQMNPNSDYVCTPTYFIPYSEATVTMDCSNYFNNYELKLD